MTAGRSADRMRSPGRELRQWTQIGAGTTHGPNGGMAESLDEAKAVFRAPVGGAPRRCASREPVVASIRFRRERARNARREHFPLMAGSA
jgi:hypothetical protein